MAFAHALPPLYAYLIPLLAAAFVLALILKEIPLRTSPSTSQPPARPTAGRSRAGLARPPSAGG
jgi:hypothetical protein